MNSKTLFLVVIIAAMAAVVMSAVTIGSKNSLARSETADRLDQGVILLTERRAEVQVSLPLFQRVDDHYMRGAQPRRGGVDVLRRMGVKTIVDLRSSYEHTDDIGVSAERLGLRYFWLPMSVWDPPADEEAAQFISVVADSGNAPLFVFCTDGVNRTGEMTAIYRIAHNGWNVEESLKEMDAAGFNPWYSSLRNYVWVYARKYRPQAVPSTARR